ncbi:MAG: hypothetical protein Q9220_001505 [cf. Caloplaca sp. 1 TL-2023]
MANTTVSQSTHTPQRKVPALDPGHQLPWTERVARSRAKAPMRRLSAGEETRDSRDIDRPHLAKSFDATWPWIQKAFGSTTTPLFGLPSRVEVQQGAGTFAPPIRSEESFLTTQERLENAFALHAIHQAGGSILQNEFAIPALGTDGAAPERSKRLRLTQKNRTLILGHKAGFWLYDTSFKAFCDLTEALLLHHWHQFGGYTLKNRSANAFVVDIESDNGVRKVKISERTAKDEKRYRKELLPIFEGQDSKPRIRVRAANAVDVICGLDCDCDDPKELEVEAPDVGFLRASTSWDQWEDQRQLIENSQRFVSSTVDLLFPISVSPASKVFIIELPDGRSFDFHRDVGLALGKEVQEALSDVVSQIDEEGRKPNKIQLWRRRSSVEGEPGNAVLSPGPKSPGLARAEGAIFVHRPARFTHFQYDAPHTMKRFFNLVRTQLYPDASEELCVRISPSEAFRKQGKILTSMKERGSSDYTELHEQYWDKDVMGRWITAEEDVWVMQVFDAIRVVGGRKEAKEPMDWDMTAFNRRRDEQTGQIDEWNVPSETLMHELAKISIKLLDIDPPKSTAGIVIHVVRDLPPGTQKEWLRWGPEQSFINFMLEILYKIDGDTIAIYPGDYDQEESDVSTTAMIHGVVESMRARKKRKMILEHNAVEGH